MSASTRGQETKQIGASASLLAVLENISNEVEKSLTDVNSTTFANNAKASLRALGIKGTLNEFDIISGIEAELQRFYTYTENLITLYADGRWANSESRIIDANRLHADNDVAVAAGEAGAVAPSVSHSPIFVDAASRFENYFEMFSWANPQRRMDWVGVVPETTEKRERGAWTANAGLVGGVSHALADDGTHPDGGMGQTTVRVAGDTVLVVHWHPGAHQAGDTFVLAGDPLSDMTQVIPNGVFATDLPYHGYIGNQAAASRIIISYRRTTNGPVQYVPAMEGGGGAFDREGVIAGLCTDVRVQSTFAAVEGSDTEGRRAAGMVIGCPADDAPGTGRPNLATAFGPMVLHSRNGARSSQGNFIEVDTLKDLIGSGAICGPTMPSLMQAMYEQVAAMLIDKGDDINAIVRGIFVRHGLDVPPELYSAWVCPWVWFANFGDQRKVQKAYQDFQQVLPTLICNAATRS